MVRHFVRLSQKNYGIDLGVFPLGSCTMKHNPRLNEKVARLPGFADAPPAAAGRHRPGRAGVDRRVGELAEEADRHAGRRDRPQGRRPWRAVRAARDPAALRRAATAREVSWCRKRPMAPILPPPRRCGFAVYRSRPPIAAGSTSSAEGAAGLRRGGGDDYQSQYLRPVRARDGAISGGPRGRRAHLLRRRQFQCDRRPGAARRSRHRCDAHQPAQDLLDPAWRRRSGAGPVVLLRGVDAVRAAPLRRTGETRLSCWRRRQRPSIMARACRPNGRLPRPDGHVHPGADLYPQPRRGRAAAGVWRRGAQRQLHLAQPRGRARRALRASGPCMHEALFQRQGPRPRAI